jgi:hypothetical protein
MPAIEALVAAATLACVQPTASAPEPPTISYAFAPDLGSGVYDWGGRTLQVYRLPIGWTLRPAEPGWRGKPGIRLRVPVTAGFLSFRTEDLLEGELPSSVDMLSIAPGVELEFQPGNDWSVRPWAAYGFNFLSGADDARTAAIGVDADQIRPLRDGELQLSTRISYTYASYQGCTPDDDLGRARVGVEWRRPTPWSPWLRRLVYGPFGIGEWVFDPPVPTVPDKEIARLQLEVGVMLGLEPMPEVFGITMPRIGVSYRFAGDFSGWRLVLGGPL